MSTTYETGLGALFPVCLQLPEVCPKPRQLKHLGTLLSHTLNIGPQILIFPVTKISFTAARGAVTVAICVPLYAGLRPLTSTSSDVMSVKSVRYCLVDALFISIAIDITDVQRHNLLQ